jgi:dCMP deaminase
MVERASGETRPGAFEHFLNRAKTAAERSTCLRRKVGAVIIKDDVEISSGYVGSARGEEHCIDMGQCLRFDLGIPSGQRYELCRSVHAEQNALINAARTGVSTMGGEMFISSEKLEGRYRRGDQKGTEVYGPCIMCAKQLINAGIVAVHMREERDGQVQTYGVEDLRQILREHEEAIAIQVLREGQPAQAAQGEECETSGRTALEIDRDGTE